MGKLSKDRRDIYYRKAKESGYRARSSFKLIQINEKFEILKLFYPKDYIDNITTPDKTTEQVGKTLENFISIYNESFCYTIVDLCAAPGSWSQVLKNICLFNYFQALNFLKHNIRKSENEKFTYVEDDFVNTFSLYINNNEQLESKIETIDKDARLKEPKIIAVDLQEMGNMKYVNIIQGDITKMSTVEQILKHIEGEAATEKEEKRKVLSKLENNAEADNTILNTNRRRTENKKRQKQLHYADIVVCDGAPDITGMNDVDEFIQSQLILSSLKVCCSVLKLGGNFISKIFRGEHTGLLIMHLNNFFEKVYICKPQSSRHKSLEAFLVCLNFSLPLSNIVALNNNQKKKTWEKGKFSEDQLRKIHTRIIKKKDQYIRGDDNEKGSGEDEHEEGTKHVEESDESENEVEEEGSEENLSDDNDGDNDEDNDGDNEQIDKSTVKEKATDKRGEVEREETKKKDIKKDERKMEKMDVFNFYYSDSDEEITYFDSEGEEVVNNYIAHQNFNSDKFFSFVATQNYYDSDKSYLLPTNYVRLEPQLMPLKPPYLLSLQKKRQEIKDDEDGNE